MGYGVKMPLSWQGHEFHAVDVDMQGLLRRFTDASSDPLFGWGIREIQGPEYQAQELKMP